MPPDRLREKPDMSQPAPSPVITENLTTPLIASGASADSDGSRSAYLPVAEVVAEPTTVTCPTLQIDRYEDSQKDECRQTRSSESPV